MNVPVHPQNDSINGLFQVNLCDSPCKAEPGAEVKPERTSTAGPGPLSERKSQLGSLRHSAGKRSASPFLCRTCGTKAAHKLLYLKGHREENQNCVVIQQDDFRTLDCLDVRVFVLL